MATFLCVHSTTKLLTRKQEEEIETRIKAIHHDMSVTAYEGPEKSPRVWIEVPDNGIWHDCMREEKQRAMDMLTGYLDKLGVSRR